MPVGVAKIAVGVDDVADALLELLGARKATVALALPDEFIIHANFEIAASAGNERHFTQILTEGGQQFCAIQPARSSQLHWVQ